MTVDPKERARAIEVLTPLLGRPYALNGVAPKSFDCWGLARYLQREIFGHDLDAVVSDSLDLRVLVRTIRDHPERRNWAPVDRPTHGALVEMSHSRHPHHIGVFLDVDGGGIAHCYAPAGVSFDPIVALKAAGWRRFTHYEWVGQTD